MQGRFGVDLGLIRGRSGVDSGIPWLGGGWYLRRCFSVSPGCLRRCFFVSLGRAGWPTTRARNKNWNINNEPNHISLGDSPWGVDPLTSELQTGDPYQVIGQYC